MVNNYTFTDAVAGSPAYDAGTLRMARSGAYGWTSDNVPRSGALNGVSFLASLTGGTTINVGPGNGIVHGVTAATSEGVYEVYSTTTWPQVLAAASVQDRIDIVYARVWNDEVDASGFKKFDFVYLQGTPAGSPTEPSIPAGQAGFKICRISVPASGAAALTQAGVMPYAVAAGGILPFYGGTTAFLPIAGQVRIRLDLPFTTLPGPLEAHDGTAWRPIVPDGYGRGFVGAQAGTLSQGTPGGATETLDSVLGTLAVTLTAGRRYRVVMTGLVGNGNAAETYYVRIRDSQSASAPTAASTLIAENMWTAQATGSPGRQPVPLEDTFIAGGSGTGTHTLGFFSVRAAGSGSFTAISPPTKPRRIQVFDASNI